MSTFIPRQLQMILLQPFTPFPATSSLGQQQHCQILILSGHIELWPPQHQKLSYFVQLAAEIWMLNIEWIKWFEIFLTWLCTTQPCEKVFSYLVKKREKKTQLHNATNHYHSSVWMFALSSLNLWFPIFQTNWHFDHNGSSLGLFTLRSCLSSQANRDPLFQNHTVFYGLTSMIWAKKENCCGHETLRNNVLRFSNWRSFWEKCL